jgi:hypothetical protein
MNANEPQTFSDEYPRATNFDGTLGKFNMEQMPFILQLMDPNFKPVHVRTYTVPRSVEQRLQQRRKF